MNRMSYRITYYFMSRIVYVFLCVCVCFSSVVCSWFLLLWFEKRNRSKPIHIEIANHTNQRSKENERLNSIANEMKKKKKNIEQSLMLCTNNNNNRS